MSNMRPKNFLYFVLSLSIGIAGCGGPGAPLVEEQQQQDDTRALPRLAQLLREAQKHLLSDTDLAQAAAEAALDEAIAAQDPLGQMRAYGILGEVCQRRSELPESVNYLLKAIEIGEEYSFTEHLAAAYHGLGTTFYLLNDLDKTKTYMQKAAQIKWMDKDYTNYALMMMNIAEVYYNKRAYAQSIALLKMAEAQLVSENKENHLAALYNALGTNYLIAYSDLDSAEIFYNKSLALSEEQDYREIRLAAYRNLGDLYFRRKKYPRAIAYFQEALRTEAAQVSGRSLIAIYSAMSEVYDSMRDYRQAYEWQKRRFELDKEVFEQDKRKVIEELQIKIDEFQIKYKMAKKERDLGAEREGQQRLHLEAARDKNRLLMLILGLVLLLSGAAFVWFYFRQQRRAA